MTPKYLPAGWYWCKYRGDEKYIFQYENDYWQVFDTIVFWDEDDIEVISERIPEPK